MKIVSTLFGVLISSALTTQAMAADAPVPVAAASAVVRASDAAKKINVVGAKQPVATGKVAGQAGAVIAKPGDNQYPSGSPIIPPKPKKEGLEAAGAIKAKAAQP